MTSDEAIKIFNTVLAFGKCDCSKDKIIQAFDMAIEALKEQKTGHWTHDGSNWTNRWMCSECGYKLCYEQSRFCPDCGARMEAKE